MAIHKWAFTGLDGKNCLFASDRVKYFIPPYVEEIDGRTGKSTNRNGIFAGGGRTVVIWSNDSLGQYLFVDVFKQEVGPDGSLKDILKGAVPDWQYVRQCPEMFPESNQFLETGKYFLFEELTSEIEHPVIGHFRKYGPSYQDFLDSFNKNRNN